jgi:ABC-type branched-subunit amino acid transport system substrate-binding protein
MRWILLLVLVAFVTQIRADVANGTITLGISVTNSPASSSRAIQGKKILQGLNHWLETINYQSKPIRGQSYQFELKVLYDNGSGAAVKANYNTLMADTTVDFLLGPVGAEASNPISNLTNAAGRLLVGTSVGSVQFYTNKDYSYSVVTAATKCPTVAFPYFRLNNGRRVALLISQATLTKEACEGLTDQVVSKFCEIRCTIPKEITNFDTLHLSGRITLIEVEYDSNID